MQRHKYTADVILKVGATETQVRADVSYLLDEHGPAPEVTVISVKVADNGHPAPWLEPAILGDSDTIGMMVDHARRMAGESLRAA
jgi:hypothetical protein